MSAQRIAIIDDDAEYASHLATCLTEAGIATCDIVSELRSLDESFYEKTYDAILVDWEFHGVTRGPDIVRAIRNAQPAAQVVVHSKYPHLSDVSARFGADAFLVKGISSEDIAATVANILERSRSPRLIELPDLTAVVSVSKDFHRLISDVAAGYDGLLRLTSREFEEFIAALWRRLGYSVTLTAATRDGGYDVAAIRGGEADVRFLIECKRYAKNRSVDVSVVRSLHGVISDQGATKGILATTSTISGPAQKYLAVHKWQLEGRDYSGIVAWAKAAQRL